MEQVINVCGFNIRGFAGLFLKEISINNFKSFYGEHILGLEK